MNMFVHALLMRDRKWSESNSPDIIGLLAQTLLTCSVYIHCFTNKTLNRKKQSFTDISYANHPTS